MSPPFDSFGEPGHPHESGEPSPGDEGELGYFDDSSITEQGYHCEHQEYKQAEWDLEAGDEQEDEALGQKPAEQPENDPVGVEAEGVDRGEEAAQDHDQVGDEASTPPAAAGEVHPPWRVGAGPVEGRAAEQWERLGDAVRRYIEGVPIGGVPGEWQHRDVAGRETAEELFEFVRREVEATAKVDVLVFAGGVTVVLPSERKDSSDPKILRRIFVEATATVGRGLFDAWVGVPVSALWPPTDFPSAVSYAVGVAALRGE